jgi:hypothetical protein
VIGLVRNLMSPHRVIWPLMVGALTIGSSIWAYADESQRTLCPLGATTVTSACSVAKPGLGIYMLGAGGAALLASGIFFLRLPPKVSTSAIDPARDPMSVTRECAHCKSQIRPDASVCPHCQRESAAWTLKENLWWRKEGDSWMWLDPAGPPGTWHPWEEESVTSS